MTLYIKYSARQVENWVVGSCNRQDILVKEKPLQIVCELPSIQFWRHKGGPGLMLQWQARVAGSGVEIKINYVPKGSHLHYLRS